MRQHIATNDSYAGNHQDPEYAHREVSRLKARECFPGRLVVSHWRFHSHIPAQPGKRLSMIEEYSVLAWLR